MKLDMEGLETYHTDKLILSEIEALRWTVMLFGALLFCAVIIATVIVAGTIDKQKEELNEEYNGSRRDYGGDSGGREGSIAKYDDNACAAACAGTAVGQAVFLARQSARAYGGSFIKPGTCVDRRASGAAGGTAAATSYPDPGRAAGGIRL